MRADPLGLGLRLFTGLLSIVRIQSGRLSAPLFDISSVQYRTVNAKGFGADRALGWFGRKDDGADD